MASLRILTLGDSFTSVRDRSGAGVASAPGGHSLQFRPSGSASPRVQRGVSAYGLRQMRLLMEELLPPLRPNLVVLGIYREQSTGSRSIHLFSRYAVVRSEIPRLKVVGMDSCARLEYDVTVGRATLDGRAFPSRGPPHQRPVSPQGALSHWRERPPEAPWSQAIRTLAPLLEELDQATTWRSATLFPWWSF